MSDLKCMFIYEQELNDSIMFLVTQSGDSHKTQTTYFTWLVEICPRLMCRNAQITFFSLSSDIFKTGGELCKFSVCFDIWQKELARGHIWNICANIYTHLSHIECCEVPLKCDVKGVVGGYHI